MKKVGEDLRYALRMLRKSPVFTIVASLILAVGIGANTAIFTLLDQILFRRLPIQNPESLVVLRYSGSDTGTSRARGDAPFYFSYPMYQDLHDQNSVFSGLIATDLLTAGVQWRNQPDLAETELVSGNYFDVLGIKPVLGRLLDSNDDIKPEASPVVVISFDYWQRRFAADPTIVNQSILINGHPFSVIGVAPPEFRSVVRGDHPDIFAPMMMKAQITPTWNEMKDRRSKWLNILGKVKPGVTREQAQAGIDPLWHSIRTEELKEIGSRSKQFQDSFLTHSHLFLDEASKGVPINGAPTTLLVIMGLSGLMALMSCVNVASLLIVRMAARTREISVRYALGAKRARLMQQLFTEGMLLGLMGGVFAIVLAPQITKLLIFTIWSDNSDRLNFNAHPDLRVFAFNFAFGLGVSVLFSLAPALQFWRPDVMTVLKQQATAIAGESIYLRRASVVAQIGLSLLLLTGAGLFIHTLHNLRLVDIGFVPDHLLTFRINPVMAGYQANQTPALYQKLLEKLSPLPGVANVAATNNPELANTNHRTNITIAGHVAAENEDMQVEWGRISQNYFSTLKMPLLAGRDLTEQDRAGARKVAVVNETFARRYFPHPQDALGHYFCSGAGNVKPDIEIVGVVRDVIHQTIRSQTRSTVFTPYWQPEAEGQIASNMAFYVRTWQAPESAEAMVRQVVQSFDSRLVMNHFLTMPQQVEENLTDEKIIAFIATSFGLLAAFMAAIGTYGVLAYSIAQRTREIGVRIALGAQRANIASVVFAEVFRLVGVGVAVGFPLSLLLTRAVRAQLFGISNYDTLTLIASCCLVSIVALGAAAIPMRRAAKIEPMVALRYE